MALEPAHGECIVECEGGLIKATLKGMFNVAGGKRYTEGVQRYVEAMNGKPFVILVNNQALEGATPEAYQELERYNQWLNKQNMVAKAMVIDSKLQAGMIDAYSPARQEQNTRSFSDEISALEWLKLQMPDI